MGSIRVCFKFDWEFLVSFEVIKCVRVFNICDKRMILANLNIVISELILVMLIFRSLNFIFVRILGILVIVWLSLAIDSNSEKFPSFIISSTCSYCILNYFKCFIDRCKCIKVNALYTWFKCGLTRLRSLNSFPDILYEFNECLSDINTPISLSSVNNKVELCKFNCWASNFTTIKYIYEELCVMLLLKLLLEHIYIDTLKNMLTVVTWSCGQEKCFTDNLNNVGADFLLFLLLIGEILTESSVNFWKIIDYDSFKYTVNISVNECNSLLNTHSLLFVVVLECLFMLILVVGKYVLVAHLRSPLVVEPYLYLDWMHISLLLQADFLS